VMDWLPYIGAVVFLVLLIDWIRIRVRRPKRKSKLQAPQPFKPPQWRNRASKNDCSPIQ